MNKRAVVLLSGGLDSAVVLFYAKSKGYDCLCLNFDYGQRHNIEIRMAEKLARSAGAEFSTVRIGLPWGGSSLLEGGGILPVNRTADRIKKDGIPSTYVPGRNTIFLSLAASYAEAAGTDTIFVGAHIEDSSGYPDCSPRYINAMRKAVSVGTKRGLEGRLDIEAPLIKMSKKDIIALGHKLKVPFEHTWSCYAGGESPCGECDSCVLRRKGFSEAGLKDPAEVL